MIVKEKLTPEEERLWTIAGIITVPISIGGIVYTIAFIKPSFEVLVLYAFLLWAPVSTGICFLTYEISSSLKIEKPFIFHVKRFLFRTIASSGYWMLITLFWNVFNFFLSPPISHENILLISFVTATLIICVFIIISKTRDILIKLFAGEW